jgi:serine protease
MVQTAVKLESRSARHLLTACVGLCLTLPLSTQARNLQWYFDADTTTAAPASMKTEPIEPGQAQVVVAVIDSGVLVDHPALKGKLLPGFDMVSEAQNGVGGRSPNYTPSPKGASCGQRMVSSSFRTHGTEVASIVAGNGHQEMWGVNPNALILPIRVFGPCGMTREDLVDSIRWAAGLPVAGVPANPRPARVINISISGGANQCRPSLQAAVNDAIKQGAFVVAAAGNNFQRPLVEPANCEGVISVGALSADNRIENYSALDPRTTIYTVGGGPTLKVSEPWAENKLRVATIGLSLFGAEQLVVADKGVGTSFAAPLVSGFLSLWLSHRPNLKPSDWSNYAHQFVRSVPKLAKCPDCTPQGLVVAESILKVQR